MPRTGWSSSRNLQESIRETFIDPDAPRLRHFGTGCFSLWRSHPSSLRLLEEGSQSLESDHYRFHCYSPVIQSEISDFGSEMQDSSNFKISFRRPSLTCQTDKPRATRRSGQPACTFAMP